MQSTGALRGIMRKRGRKRQTPNAQFARSFISRSLAHLREHQRLIPRVFYDLAISPCCADFINSTGYLPYSLLSPSPPPRSPLFRPLFRLRARISRVARTVTGGITGCIIYSTNSQTLEALSALRRNLPCKIIELNNNTYSRGDPDSQDSPSRSSLKFFIALFFYSYNSNNRSLTREGRKIFERRNNKHRWKFLDKLEGIRFLPTCNAYDIRNRSDFARYTPVLRVDKHTRAIFLDMPACISDSASHRPRK